MVSNTGEIFTIPVCELFSDTDNKKWNYGATYVRWGRKTCDGNATVVYQGTLFIVHKHIVSCDIDMGFLSVCPSVTFWYYV